VGDFAWLNVGRESKRESASKWGGGRRGSVWVHFVSS